MIFVLIAYVPITPFQTVRVAGIPKSYHETSVGLLRHCPVLTLMGVTYLSALSTE